MDIAPLCWAWSSKEWLVYQNRCHAMAAKVVSRVAGAGFLALAYGAVSGKMRAYFLMG
jgi:hypothetical protein